MIRTDMVRFDQEIFYMLDFMSIDTHPDDPVDLSLLIENSMGDDHFFREMIHLFISQGRAQLQTLEQLCHDGNNQNWVETAHSLKGTAAMIGAESMRKLAAIAQKMEDQTATGRHKIMTEITQEYQKSCNFLKEKGLTNPA